MVVIVVCEPTCTSDSLMDTSIGRFRVNRLPQSPPRVLSSHCRPEKRGILRVSFADAKHTSDRKASIISDRIIETLFKESSLPQFGNRKSIHGSENVIPNAKICNEMIDI